MIVLMLCKSLFFIALWLQMYISFPLHMPTSGKGDAQICMYLFNFYGIAGLGQGHWG